MTRSASQERRRPWRFLPALLLLAVIGWTAYIGFSYVPGKFEIGMNYIDRDGRPLNGAGGGVRLVWRGLTGAAWRELSTGVEMLFATTPGKLILVSAPTLVLLQLGVWILGRRRPAAPPR